MLHLALHKSIIRLYERHVTVFSPTGKILVVHCERLASLTIAGPGRAELHRERPGLLEGHPQECRTSPPEAELWREGCPWREGREGRGPWERP